MSEEVTVVEPRNVEIDVLGFLIVLAQHKRFLIGLPILVAFVAALVSLGLPNIYTGTTKLLPPQQNQSAAIAMLAQLGAPIAGLTGSALKNSNDLYVTMLRSRTLADSLIDRFDLREIYGTTSYGGARHTLASRTNIASGRDNVITVEVDDTDPKRAATLANGYVEELLKLTQTLAVAEASQRRLFLEGQLAQSAKNLAGAEVTARQALDKGGLVIVDAQGRSIIETTGRLRGQITAKEVEIGAMRAFATAANPDLKRAQHEVESMKQELARIEGVARSVPSNRGEAAKSEGMENLRLLRDVKYHETVYELLARQYEVAKLDEAADSSVVRILDKAIEPEGKSKPRRTVIVVSSFLAAFLFAFLLVMIKVAILSYRSNVVQAKRLDILRDHLRHI